jgi:alginate O-acetyltransferase complex protein AlgI
MLFNSVHFAIFLPIVFILYWFVANKSLKSQNFLLLVSSYFFYSCWDWRFLFLLIFSTLLDYYTGLKISNTKKVISKRFWFWLSITVNLGFLGVFKYYNFFALSFAEAIGHLGLHVNIWTLNIILPVGISFYTFHGLSYIIDINNGRIQAEKNFIDYAVFVCFFPLLVAGPIERATHLLPQIQEKRTFDYFKALDGLKQILWGLFKKVVIADQCANYANMIFNDSSHYSGSTLLLSAVFFTFQIYCDFSGYSDIALGTARLFGIELLRNFDYPYFSRSVSEFWRRWHISLSTWFNDYLFTPIVTYLRDWNKLSVAAGILFTFFLSGLWHGAGWNFIIYGCLHGIAITYEFYTKKQRKKFFKKLPDFISSFIAQISVFGFVIIGFIFFRARNIRHALSYLSGIFSSSIISRPFVSNRELIMIMVIILFMTIEWFGKKDQYAIATFGFRWPAYIRYSFYYTLVLSILIFNGSNQQFIYFQF